ncbi:MAG: hypothetical protein JST39_11050, partial [Bacteroidetes bacterium]|nr:hypothetical protein [Bacteroidota bacterium]
MGRVFLFFLVLFAACDAVAQRLPSAFFREYQKAETFFNLAASTPFTDAKALRSYQEAIRLFDRRTGEDSLLFDCYLKTGILFMTDSSYEASLKAFQKAIQVKKNTPGLSDKLFFKPYLYAGNACYQLY